MGESQNFSAGLPLKTDGDFITMDRQAAFRYFNFQLLKAESLGIGSYGAVYKARCDALPCAAKILHPTLFQTHDPGARKIMERFEQECDFLSSIRHPHIVQYLGVAKDQGSGLPVLLMELMDTNLTKFLEQSQQPVAYHIQVNLCHDIALALVYLHSNGIIHRDLSSNNVLLIANSRAKVTDFGMSRLANVNPRMTPLTQCPGTQAYMPPEALRIPPQYGEKLDCFSFGVVGIQIMTRIFPDPEPCEEIVEDPRSPTGIIKMPVRELERRKNHIALINPNHPLLAVALDMLKDRDYERPSSQEISSRLSALKEAPQYAQSKQQMLDRSNSIESGERYTRGQYEKQVEGLRQQLKIANQELKQKDKLLFESRTENMLFKKDLEKTIQELRAHVDRKDAVLLESQGEIVQLKSALDLTTRQLKERQKELRELEGQFSALKVASDQATRQVRHMQQSLDAKEKQLKELQERNGEMSKQLNKRHGVVFDDDKKLTKPIPVKRKAQLALGISTTAGDRKSCPPNPSLGNPLSTYHIPGDRKSCPPNSIAPESELTKKRSCTVGGEDYHLNSTWPTETLQEQSRLNPKKKPVPMKRNREPVKLLVPDLPSLRKTKSETNLSLEQMDPVGVMCFWRCPECPNAVPDTYKACPMCQTSRRN